MKELVQRMTEHAQLFQHTTVKWMIAAFDGDALHLVPDDPIEKP